MRVTLALTGASGMQYALRLLQCLVQADVQVDVILSRPALVVMGMDTGLKLSGSTGTCQQQLSEYCSAPPERLRVLGLEQWTASVASGSGVADAMVVCPCTTGTLANIANGICGNLIDRAADVVLKERRKLILMPREMPFSSIHLENMLKLSRSGAVIMPPVPGFYHHPESIDDLVDFVVARVLDQLGIEQQMVPRWGA